jgi:hypothetical protein
MAKLLIGDKNHIDFASPIKLNDEQLKKFMTFLNDMFAVVQIQNVINFRNDRIGDKFFSVRWDSEEYAVLAKIDINTRKVSEMLGRSWMSVDIKRGSIIPDLLTWLKKNGKTPTSENIEEFLKTKDAEKTVRKQKRLEIRMLNKRKLEEIFDIEREIKRTKTIIFQGNDIFNGQNMKEKLTKLDEELAKKKSEMLS